jgi:DNA-binding HxlR family transcriptional regulator
MVSDGLLTKKSFNELPPRVEYQLTDLGQKLVDVLWKLNDWGKLLVDKDEC